MFTQQRGLLTRGVGNAFASTLIIANTRMATREVQSSKQPDHDRIQLLNPSWAADSVCDRSVFLEMLSSVSVFCVTGILPCLVAFEQSVSSW